MGRQVGFFMLPEDEQDFASFVLGDRRVVFLPDGAEYKPIPTFRSLAEANQTRYPLWLLIWNRGIGSELTLHEYGPGNIRVDKCNGPVIEFNRSVLHGEVLLAGRIWAEMNTLDSAQLQIIYKGKDFEQWYSSIARWIRRHYDREKKYGMYIGPKASEHYQKGDFELAQGLTASGPI